jgi:hypothetical protein
MLVHRVVFALPALVLLIVVALLVALTQKSVPGLGIVELPAVDCVTDVNGHNFSNQLVIATEHGYHCGKSSRLHSLLKARNTKTTLLMG